MKPQKILTVIAIALLALLLTGCGPTLKEKIAEVQASSTITTADVVELLELEGLEVKLQKAGYAIHKSLKGVNVYKLDGENLLFLINFDGAPWERDNYLSDLGLRYAWYWGSDAKTEQICSIVQEFKPETGNYSIGYDFAYKNILAVYVTYLGVTEEMSRDEISEKLDIAAATTGKVRKVFLEDMNDMQTSEYTADGQYFTAKVTSYFSQVPYEYDSRLMYIYLEDSKCTVFLNEDIAEQYQGQKFEICFKGPLEGPAASSGSHGLGGTIDNTMSFALGSSREHTGYSKEPYAGPIQYEVTLTIGDGITETLIVGSEGEEAAG